MALVSLWFPFKATTHPTDPPSHGTRAPAPAKWKTDNGPTGSGPIEATSPVTDDTSRRAAGFNEPYHKGENTHTFRSG